jgi:hypothetical protein
MNSGDGIAVGWFEMTFNGDINWRMNFGKSKYLLCIQKSCSIKSVFTILFFMWINKIILN